MPEQQVTTTNSDSSSGMDVGSFAAKIKAKYPKDKNLSKHSDQEITDAWIKKYPGDKKFLKETKSQSTPVKKESSSEDSVRAGTMMDTVRSKADYALAAMPSVLASAGNFTKKAGPAGYIEGSALADVGGATGKAIEIMGKKGLYGPNYGPHGFDIIHQSAVEGMHQAAWDVIGRGMGDGLFKLASKIPHVKIQNGIPLLPSQQEGKKGMTKFAEDMLRNVWPSSSMFDKVEAAQGAKIFKAGEDIGDTIGKFKGTRDQLGKLIQEAISGAEKAAKPDVKKFATKEAYEAAVDKWKNHFSSGLLGRIQSKGNPATIAAALTSEQFSHDQVKEVIDYLAEHRSAVLDYTRGQIWSEAINNALRNSKDPTIMGSKMVDDKLTGKGLRHELDRITGERLDDIYSPQQLKNITKFEETIGKVGAGGQGWIGRFKNFIYTTALIGGLSGHLVSGQAAVGQMGLFYVAGKIMTNPKGAQAYENLIRVTAANMPRAIAAAKAEYKTYVDHAEQDYERDRKQAELDWMKQNGVPLPKKVEEENKFKK